MGDEGEFAGWCHFQRGTDHQHEVAGPGFLEGSQVGLAGQVFPKQDGVGFEDAAAFASGYLVRIQEYVSNALGGVGLVAARTGCCANVAMEFEDALASCLLVQSIYVLGDDGVEEAGGFQLSQG